MSFERELRRLMIGLLAAFAIVGLAAAYYVVTGADTILTRSDNPRRVLEEAALLRGSIHDRDGEILVSTIPQGDGTTLRQYLYPVMNSALGYYSFRHGTGGTEGAFDAILRGDTLTPDLIEELSAQLMHRPQQGSDIKITLDLGIQTAIMHAMEGQRGAAVVIRVPSGEILSMVSLPTFDPNLLDVQWETLRDDPGNPFFDRALQGSYQPGAALQTPLIAAALLLDAPIDAPIEGASESLMLDGLELECAARLPSLALTLREAYQFACPGAFSAFLQTVDPNVIQAVFDTFRLEQSPALAGFTESAAELAISTPIPFTMTDANAIPQALGQGDQTVSPLTMALIAAAIAHDGNAPAPYILSATRPPGATEWTPLVHAAPTIPLMTDSTARQLQDLMRGAVAQGAAQNAGRPAIDIGGHVALAYSGDDTLVWFIGFATLGGDEAVAVAVVLEGSDDPGLAADIGGTALDSAGRAFRMSLSDAG